MGAVALLGGSGSHSDNVCGGHAPLGLQASEPSGLGERRQGELSAAEAGAASRRPTPGRHSVGQWRAYVGISGSYANEMTK